MSLAVGVAVTGLVVRAPLLRTAARLGSRWGVVFGALWVVEMTAANEWYAVGTWRLVPYFGSILGVLVLNVLAGAVAARRYGGIAVASHLVVVGMIAGTTLATLGALIGCAMPRIPTAAAPAYPGPTTARNPDVTGGAA
jgi:hypothetical protein